MLDAQHDNKSLPRPLHLVVVFVPRWRRPARLDHVLQQLEARLGSWLPLCKRQVGKHGRVANEARVGIAHNVGLPLPARRVWMTCANVLLLQPFELLLRT